MFEKMENKKQFVRYCRKQSVLQTYSDHSPLLPLALEEHELSPRSNRSVVKAPPASVALSVAGSS